VAQSGDDRVCLSRVFPIMRTCTHNRICTSYIIMIVVVTQYFCCLLSQVQYVNRWRFFCDAYADQSKLLWNLHHDWRMEEGRCADYGKPPGVGRTNNPVEGRQGKEKLFNSNVKKPLEENWASQLGAGGFMMTTSRVSRAHTNAHTWLRGFIHF
jgi:hypothetical protein